jgi:hypothetical protein
VEALTDVPGVDLVVRIPDPGWLSDRERLEAWRVLRRARNRLDAAMCRLVGEIDRDRSCETDDAPTVTSWLVAEGESAPAARAVVASGRVLPEMPTVTEHRTPSGGSANGEGSNLRPNPSARIADGRQGSQGAAASGSMP